MEREDRETDVSARHRAGFLLYGPRREIFHSNRVVCAERHIINASFCPPPPPHSPNPDAQLNPLTELRSMDVSGGGDATSVLHGGGKRHSKSAHREPGLPLPPLCMCMRVCVCGATPSNLF